MWAGGRAKQQGCGLFAMFGVVVLLKIGYLGLFSRFGLEKEGSVGDLSLMGIYGCVGYVCVWVVFGVFLACAQY